MRIAWWRELLRRRRRVTPKPRPNDVRLLAFEEMEERRMLALPSGFATSTYSAPWIAMGPSVIATQPSVTLSGVTVQNGSVPEDVGLTTPAPADPVEGAVTSVAVDPTNANIGWIGTTNGGIWETQNLGAIRPAPPGSHSPTTVVCRRSPVSMPIRPIRPATPWWPASHRRAITTAMIQIKPVPTISLRPWGGATTGILRSTNASSTGASFTLLSGFPTGQYYVAEVEQGSIILAASDAELSGVKASNGVAGAVPQH